MWFDKRKTRRRRKKKQQKKTCIVSGSHSARRPKDKAANFQKRYTSVLPLWIHSKREQKFKFGREKKYTHTHTHKLIPYTTILFFFKKKIHTRLKWSHTNSGN